MYPASAAKHNKRMWNDDNSASKQMSSAKSIMR